MDDDEAIDPLSEAIGLVLAGIASSLVATMDDAGVELFRSAYGGFFEAAHADENQSPEVLEIADDMTDLLD